MTMRGVGLLRAARQALLAAEPLGCGLAGGACGSSSSSAAFTPLRQLPSLLHLAAPPQQQPHQRQQRAGLAARRRGDDDEDELPEGPHHASKLSHAERKHLAERRLRQQEAEEQRLEEELAAGMGAGEDRQQVIQGLLRGMDGQEAASKFVSSFFDERQQSGAASAAALRYKGEGGRYAPGAAAAAGGDDEGLGGGEEEEEAGEGLEEEAEGDALQVSLPEQLDEEEEFDLMSKLQGLRQGSRRIVLDKLLRGGIMRADPSAMREWQEIQGQFQPPDDFRMKVVDVNRTSKGTSTGGLYRYGCMVVVGNGNGVLGWGQGKAAEVNDAVQKAYQRACRNLYPVPRYNGHTIPEPITSKYGQVKLILYPKASGCGITANNLMREICKMAGIHDIGIKVHGSRNVRNAVKCLFQALDKMRTEDELADGAAARGSFVVTMPPGRYRHLKL